MQENIWDYVQSTLWFAWNFLNSNIITALSGALAAYVIAKKHQRVPIYSSKPFIIKLWVEF